LNDCKVGVQGRKRVLRIGFRNELERERRKDIFLTRKRDRERERGGKDSHKTTHIMSIYSEFPKGYDILPRPFVAVYGNEKFHSAVVRTLIACQTEDSHLNSKDMCKIESVPDTFTIPRKNAAFLKRRVDKKSKIFSGIDPEGVLKYGWCWKWLSKVPCCIVNLVDFTNGDWEQTMKETEKMFFQEIDMLKDKLHTKDRDTNVISLLIVSDDCNESHMNDLASNLRNGSPRTVYAVKMSEIQSGGIKPASATIQRTMRSVRHHASTCYNKQLRKYRSYRVDKRTQRALDVRHHFKQGFVHEFLGHTDKAVSCYRDAFESASLLRREDTKLSSSFGMKAIVGLINFRMTHTLLSSNRVHDAVLQFSIFTQLFGTRIEKDEYVPRHWAWMTETYSEFGALLERCDDELKIPIRQCPDDGKHLDSIFKEGYYYDFAVRVAAKRHEAANRAFRRSSLSIQQLGKKKGLNYEVARTPQWVGGNPMVIPTQISISDLAPYLQQQQGSTAATAITNGGNRRRRRGATGERTPSIDGADDVGRQMGVSKQAVPNPFECLESDVNHALAIFDLLVRVRMSQSLFPSDEKQNSNSEEEEQEEDKKNEFLTPKPSRRAKAYDSLPGKTIHISKDDRGHLGIKFDDSLKVRINTSLSLSLSLSLFLSTTNFFVIHTHTHIHIFPHIITKVLAVSPWAKKFGVMPGQTLLVCNGTRLHNTKDVVSSIPKGNKPFPLKLLERGQTLDNDCVEDDNGDEDSQSRYRTRAMLDIVEAEGHLHLKQFKECLQYLELPIQLARFEGWVAPLAKCLEMALRACLGINGEHAKCIDLALELMSPSFNLSTDRKRRLEREFLIPSWKEFEKKQRVWFVRSCNQQSAIHVVPSFSPSNASAGNTVRCTAFITSFLPSDLDVKSVRFRFDEDMYDCEWNESSSRLLRLQMGTTLKLDVSLKIARLKSDATLRLSSLEIECIPQGLSFPVRLHVSVLDTSDVLDLLRPESEVIMRWKHTEPALVDAMHFMALSIVIKSDDMRETKRTGDVAGRNVRVIFEFEDSASSRPVLRVHGISTTTITTTATTTTSLENIVKLPDLIVDETQNLQVSILGDSKTPTTTLRATVQYMDTNGCVVSKTRNISVAFADALSATFQFQSVRPHTGNETELASNVPLLMNMMISANRHRHDLVLLDTSVVVRDSKLASIRSLLSSLQNKEGIHLDPRDEFDFGYQVLPKLPVNDVSWGQVCVKWKLRDTPIETKATVTTFPLPKVNVSVQPFQVELKSPTRGSVGVPFMFDMKISNQTSITETLSIFLDVDSDETSFCAAGDTRCKINLDAGDSKSHRIVLIPLVVGLLALPNLIISTSGSSKSILNAIDRRKIFVAPS